MLNETAKQERLWGFYARSRLAGLHSTPTIGREATGSGGVCGAFVTKGPRRNKLGNLMRAKAAIGPDPAVAAHAARPPLPA